MRFFKLSAGTETKGTKEGKEQAHLNKIDFVSRRLESPYCEQPEPTKSSQKILQNRFCRKSNNNLLWSQENLVRGDILISFRPLGFSQTIFFTIITELRGWKKIPIINTSRFILKLEFRLFINKHSYDKKIALSKQTTSLYRA